MILGAGGIPMDLELGRPFIERARASCLLSCVCFFLAMELHDSEILATRPNILSELRT